MRMAVIQMPGRKGGDETGMITKWHKKTGDWVAEGDELFSFDTDDGTYTVKSQKAGRLVAVFVPEGEIVHCPADVGMLTTATPDSVLKLGRQQFLDETKPLEAREPAAEEQEEELPEEEPAEEAFEEEIPEEEPEQESFAEEFPEEEITAEAQPEAEPLPEEDAEFSEEELLEYVEEDLSDLEASEAPEDADEAEEDEETIVSEEELLQYVEEDTAELEAMDEATDEPEEESEAAEEPVEEPCAEVCECAAKPAALTAQADMTLCMDIIARTGVKLAAMVRFAAMHTPLNACLQPVEADNLRALDALDVLPNVCDLSALGVTNVSKTAGCGAFELLVPAVHNAWRVNNDALEVYPCLNLTLAFDENALALEDAAAALRETCGKLENFIDLLI